MFKFAIIFLIFSTSSETECALNSVFPSKIIANVIGAGLTDRVNDGISLAMQFCAEEFKWGKWNCPSSAFSRKNAQILTREHAFVRAIISAAIFYSISKGNCSENLSRHLVNSLEKFEKKSENQSWSWGSCSDDVGRAEEEITKIFGHPTVGGDIREFVASHNFRVGKNLVREKVEKKCRCHGVSGSCSHQTCWIQLAPFGQITKILKEKFRKSLRILNRNSHEDTRKIRTKNLIYLDESPDYCLPDYSTGLQGTRGRKCSRRNTALNITYEHEEKRSCWNLCRSCGYRVKKLKKLKKFPCNCKFVWCCEVKCETCTETVNEHVCN